MADSKQVKLIIKGDSSDVVASLTEIRNKLQDLEKHNNSITGKIKASWVNVAAGITIAQEAASKFKELLESAFHAAEYLEQFQNLDNLAKKYNTTAADIMQIMEKMTNHQVEKAELMKMSLMGIGKGLSPKMFTDLAEAAFTYSKVVGGSVTENYGKLVNAIAMGKEKGAAALVGMIDLKDKMGEMGDKTNKAGTALELYNLVMQDAHSKQKQLGEGADSSADKLEQLLTMWKNFTHHLAQIAVPVIFGIITAFQLLKEKFLTIGLAIVYPFALIEKGLNSLGITTSTVLQDTVAEQARMIEDTQKAGIKSANDFMQSVDEIHKAGEKASGKGVGSGKSKLEEMAGTKAGEGAEEMLRQYKAALEALKLNGEQLTNELTRQNQLNAVLRATDTDNLKANLDDQVQVLDYQYENELVSVSAYYDKKRELALTQYSQELSDATKNTEEMKAITQSKIDAAINQYALLNKQIMSLGGTEKERIASSNLTNELTKIGMTIEALQPEVEKLDAEGNKTIDALGNALSKTIKAFNLKQPTDEVKKLYDQLKKNNDLTKTIVSTEKEITDAMGKTAESKKLDIELSKLETEARLLDNQAQIETIHTLIESDGLNPALEKELELRKKLTGLIKAAGQAKDDDMQLDAISKGIKEVEKSWHDYETIVQKTAETAYQDAATAFSDIFYDSITGKLKSMGDYFKNMFNNILRSFTDMLGRMVAESVAKPIFLQIIGTVGGALGGAATASAASGGVNLAQGSGALAGLGQYAPLALPLGALLNGNYAGAAGGVAGFALGSMAAAPITSFLSGGMGLMSTAAGTVGTTMLTSAALSVIPIIGTVIGMALGGLIGKMFQGDDNLGIHINPTGRGAAYYKDDTQIGSRETGAGWTHHNAGDGWYATTDNMGSAPWALQLIQGFRKTSNSIESVMGKLGLDTSGFGKEFNKTTEWAAGKGTPEEMAATLETWFGEWITQATNLNFAQFSKDGETLTVTITRILNSLGQINGVKDIDVSKVFADINLKAKTLSEGLQDADKNIYEMIDGLSELTGAEFGDKLTEIATAFVDRIKLVNDYLIFTKQLQQDIDTDVKNRMEQYRTVNMTSSERWEDTLSKGYAAYGRFIAEVTAAEPDASKIKQAYNDTATLFDAIYNGIMQLKGVSNSMGDTIKKVTDDIALAGIESKYQGDTEKIRTSKIDYFNGELKRLQEDLMKSGVADDPEKVKAIWQQMQQYSSAGWGMMTAEEKVTYGEDFKAYLQTSQDHVNEILNVATTNAQTFWTSMQQDADTAINTIIAKQQEAMDKLSEAADKVTAAFAIMGAAAVQTAGELTTIKSDTTNFVVGVIQNNPDLVSEPSYG